MPIAHEQISVVIDGRSILEAYTKLRLPPNFSNSLPTPPKYLRSDHDPLYQFHQWQANLRVRDVKEIKTVPYVPLSHPFVERLIGTIRDSVRYFSHI